MSATAAQFRKLLPTLQHLAKFHSCNRAEICRRDGVELADVEKIVMETCGALSLWDDEYLAMAAKKVGVHVGKFSPAPLSSMPPPAPAPAVADKPAPDAAPYRHGSRMKDYREIARRLLADPALSEAAACRAVEVGQASWSCFKKKQFGSSPIAREKLAKFLGVDVPPALEEKAAPAAAEPARVKRHYKRRAVASTALQAAPATLRRRRLHARRRHLPPRTRRAPRARRHSGLSTKKNLFDRSPRQQSQ